MRYCDREWNNLADERDLNGSGEEEDRRVRVEEPVVGRRVPVPPREGHVDRQCRYQCHTLTTVSVRRRGDRSRDTPFPDTL